ncbi:MAG: hypothetical protein ABIU54_05150 [Candidatus Eisenbacteria bacterium]
MFIRRPLLLAACLCLCLSLAPRIAHAELLALGSPAPAFTKNVLNSDPWPTATLSQFSGKVVILHILGYS